MLAILELYKQEGEGFIVDVVKAYGEPDEVLVEKIASTNQKLELWFSEWLKQRQ